MSPLEKMLGLLVRALRDLTSRTETIRDFQECFRDKQLKSLIGQDIYDIFADLAVDLAYFEADPGARAQNSSLYGHERLEREIETALGQLSRLGVAVPDV
jgi:hypothetical protein